MKIHEKKTVTENKSFSFTEQEIVETLVSECRKHLPEKMQNTPCQFEFDVYGEAGTVRGLTISFNHETQLEAPATEKPTSSILGRSVDCLELSVRAANCLQFAGVETIGQLTTMTENEVRRLKNMGKRTTNEVKEALASHGLSFAQESKVK